MQRKLISAALAAAFLALPATSMAQEADLAKRVEQLAAELEKVKAELAAQRAQTAQTVQPAQAEQAAAPAPATGAAPAATTAGVQGPGAAPPPKPYLPAPFSYSRSLSASQLPADTVFTGYGEINYNHPVRNASQSQTDVRRVVIGIQHRFDDKTKMVSEFRARMAPEVIRVAP